MNIHFVQHEPFEAPGAYLKWAQDRKHQTTFSRVFENESLPRSADGIDLLIVMGGPQSADTRLEECSYFNAEAEKDLIRKCISAGKAVIGVCLGAQLIGEALGAKYEHGREKEIGNYPIELTEEGIKDENIHHFKSPLVVGHWHNDMPGLTRDCKILAFSEGCPRQIIQYQDKVYGFQCHMELTPDLVTGLIENEPDLEWKSWKYKFVQSGEEILKYNYEEMNGYLYQFLDKLAKDFH